MSDEQPQDPVKRVPTGIELAALVQRFPGLHLADEALEWRALPAFRGLAMLWVLV